MNSLLTVIGVRVVRFGALSESVSAPLLGNLVSRIALFRCPLPVLVDSDSRENIPDVVIFVVVLLAAT